MFSFCKRKRREQFQTKNMRVKTIKEKLLIRRTLRLHFKDSLRRDDEKLHSQICI